MLRYNNIDQLCKSMFGDGPLVKSVPIAVASSLHQQWATSRRHLQDCHIHRLSPKSTMQKCENLGVQYQPDVLQMSHCSKLYVA